MTTMTTSEAAARLPELLSQDESIIIRDGNKDLGLLVSLQPRDRTDDERATAWARLRELSIRTSAQLEKDLAREGITLEEFLADSLADD